MKTIKILVVEDEMIIAADISMQLTQLGYDVTGIIPRGEDALKNIEAALPDLVLMDIELKGKLDGIETASEVNRRFQIPVIFLTANTDDATFERAKETRPYAFISKPFRKAELKRAIELAIERLAEEANPASITPGGNGMDNRSYILNDRIFVRYKDKMVKVGMEEICFAEADRNYCKIKTTERDYLLTVPLGKLEESLPAQTFLRIHRSFIVNLPMVDAIGENLEYLLVGEVRVPVSRRFKELVGKRLLLI